MEELPEDATKEDKAEIEAFIHEFDIEPQDVVHVLKDLHGVGSRPRLRSKEGPLSASYWSLVIDSRLGKIEAKLGLPQGKGLQDVHNFVVSHRPAKE